MSGAKTPETQARARRWLREERLAAGMALVGIALPLATLVLGALLTDADRGAVLLPFFWWTVGTGAALLVVAAGLEIRAQGRLLEAKFTDGYRSAGMVEEVIEEPAEVSAIFTLLVVAELPGPVRIRRRLDGTEHPAGPGARVGQTVIFRHNTLDPDDFQDVQFVRFVG